MLKQQEATVDIAQLLTLFKPRNWVELTMVEVRCRDGEEWNSEVVTSRLSLDLNLVTGYWEDKDGGTVLDTEIDNYKVTESYDFIKAAFN